MSVRTGRLPDPIASPGLEALFEIASGPAEPLLLFQSASGLLGQVRWGEEPGDSDWEALEADGACWLRREGAMVSLQRDAEGGPRTLALAHPDRDALVVTWAAEGTWAAESPGSDAWVCGADGNVVQADEILARLEQGMDSLDQREQEAGAAPLAEAVPSSPGTVAPEAWDGEMLVPGLSLAAAAGLLGAAVRVVAASRPAPAPKPGTPASAPKAGRRSAPPPEPGKPAAVPEAGRPAPGPGGPAPAGRPACACGTVPAPDARFCSRCGKPLERRCPGCSSPAPGEARFCPRCGQAL